MSSPDEVAAWLYAKVMAEGILHQIEAVDDIVKRFGKRYAYENDNGNQAIRKDVLAAFRKLSENTIVWDRGGRYWRPRERGDKRGSRASY